MSDPLAAYLLDVCVTTFGLIVDNALAERVQIGVKPNVRYEPKYSLSQLLDPSFRLPRPQPVARTSGALGLSGLLALAGKKGSGVKLWAAKPN